MKNFLSLIGTIFIALVLYFTIGMSSYDSEFEDLEYFASFEGKNFYEQFKSEIDSLSQSSTDSELLENASNTESLKGLNLSLVDIYLEQGEDGKRTWEMNADWANYAEKSGNLFAYKPIVVFFDENENKEEDVHITGETGKVLDNNTLITLSRAVKIKRNTLEILSDYLEFKPEEELASIPTKALFSAEETIGKADSLDWDMLKNDIQAKGNVVFIINNDNKTYTLDDPRKNPPNI